MVFCCFVFQTDGGLALLRAARDGDLERVLECLADNVDLDACNPVRVLPVLPKTLAIFSADELVGKLYASALCIHA